MFWKRSTGIHTFIELFELIITKLSSNKDIELLENIFNATLKEISKFSFFCEEWSWLVRFQALGFFHHDRSTSQREDNISAWRKEYFQFILSVIWMRAIPMESKLWIFNFDNCYSYINKGSPLLNS